MNDDRSKPGGYSWVGKIVSAYLLDGSPRYNVQAWHGAVHIFNDKQIQPLSDKTLKQAIALEHAGLDLWVRDERKRLGFE